MDKDNKLAQAIILILVFPIAVLMMLFMTLYTPIDFLIYRFSDFYKDMRCIWGKRVRYVWLITNTEHYKLYNLIVKNSVPIQYLPREDNVCEGGFFYLNNTLFVEDALLCYNSENREWYIVYGHHESQSLEEYAELKKDRFCKSMAYNESIKCERVVFLVKEKDVSDEERAFADNSGVILTYNKNNFSEKIKSFISE